jgi:hypothetical protein
MVLPQHLERQKDEPNPKQVGEEEVEEAQGGRIEEENGERAREKLDSGECPDSRCEPSCYR